MAIRPSIAPSTPRPRTVRTTELKPNPHNPRYLFDEEPLKTLEDSIRKVGILVPLTVFKAKGDQQFTILDGQRRWICAQRAKLPVVPINEVAEPSVVQNIVTMFQIHKLRQDWELMPTALKVGVLMEELKERRDRQIAELTGLDQAVVARCKKLLWYPEKFQNMMLFQDPKDRIKADFFIEMYAVLTDRLVSKLKWYKRDELIARFLFKYQNGLSGFKAVTDFRKIKQYVSVAKKAGREKDFAVCFREFVYDDKLDISHLEISAASVHRTAAKMVKAMENLQIQIQQLEVPDFLGEEALWREMERLVDVIRRKLRVADRRVR